MSVIVHIIMIVALLCSLFGYMMFTREKLSFSQNSFLFLSAQPLPV